MTLTSILCAIDFSRESPRLLRAAIAIASAEQARLTVVHVLDPLLVQAARIKFEEGLLEESADTDLRALIAEAVKDAGAGTRHVELRVRVGPPDREILAEAAEKDADLLVIGTHGFTGVKRVSSARLRLVCWRRPIRPCWRCRRRTSSRALRRSRRRCCR